MKLTIIILLLSLFTTGCIDLGIEGEWFMDTVSVSPDGKVALCLYDDGTFFLFGEESKIYITDLKGDSFTKVTEDQMHYRSVAWSGDGKYLLYTKGGEDTWRLNLYSIDNRQSVNLLQEMYFIALPKFLYNLQNISYMVFPDGDVPFGQLNIYDRNTSSIHTLVDNVYYNYTLFPGAKKIAAVCVIEEFDEVFKGILVIKNLDGLTEEVVFNGYFSKEGNAVDITDDGKTIIFYASSENNKEMEIYLFNLKTATLTKWSGPKGYEFRLPASSLSGYILAHVKGQEDEWAGQLYLVSIDKHIIEVPGWPVWINKEKVLCLDFDEGAVLVTDLDTGEVVNLTEKFREYYGKKED